MIPKYCEVIMNAHMPMGWTPCGKPATQHSDQPCGRFYVCDEHASQYADAAPSQSAVENPSIALVSPPLVRP